MQYPTLLEKSSFKKTFDFFEKFVFVIFASSGKAASKASVVTAAPGIGDTSNRGASIQW